jgi:hypothetical protein
MKLNFYSITTSRYIRLFTLHLFFGIVAVLSTSVAKAQAGEALDFDGANDRVNLPFVISGSYTKEAWININSLAANNNIISGTATAFWAPASAGSRLMAGHGGGFNQVQDPTPLVAATWYHVAVTYNATTQEMRLYKNGVLVNSASGVAAYTETAQFIGAFNAGFVFSGRIDEVRIWNVERSATDIAASMSCTLTGDEPGLLAYYDFNQGIAGGTNTGLTTLNDLKDKCLKANATLVNFALNGTSSNWVAPGPTLTGTCASSDPNINVSGNSVCIAIGDATPSLTDHTVFGDFGIVPLTRSFTISNAGNANLTISSVAIGGVNAGDFTITTSPASSIAPAASTTLTIQFLPSGATGSKTATVTINSNDADDGSFTFTIQGNNNGQGKSLAFDGIGDFVTLPNILSGSYTKEALIFSFNTAVANNIVSGNTTAFWAPNTAGFRLTAGHAPGFSQVQDPTPLVANTWYHVAVTYDAATQVMNLYKDGVLVGTATGVPGYTETTQFIGAFNSGFFWNGRMDEVRIWNRVRSATEINDSRNCALTGDEPGLLAYYNFTNGVAGSNNSGVTLLPDVSDKCTPNNGVLNGFTLTGTLSNWVADSAALTGTCTNTFPNVQVSGNGLCITNGDNTPTMADDTDFGSFALPGTDKTFTITNTGTTTLNIGTITFAGPDNTMFTVLTPPAGTLAPGASTTVVVRFIAVGLGIKTATITINNDDTDEAAYTFAIQGLGTIPLPVTLVSFTGKIDGKTAQLRWTTATETGNKGFELQRAGTANANNWESLGFVSANTGNIGGNYQFTDRNPLSGGNYYRLKQVDLDGRFTISPIVFLNFNTKGGNISLYPNPVKDVLTLTVGDGQLLNTPIRIATATGQVLSTVILKSNRQDIELGNLSGGVYLLLFSNGEVRRVIKQ